MSDPLSHSNHFAQLPPSVRGAPSHLRDAIRKKQNSKAAKRSRVRRKERMTALFARCRKNEALIPTLKAHITSLVQIIHSKGIPIPPEISCLVCEPPQVDGKLGGIETLNLSDFEMESVQWTETEASSVNNFEDDAKMMKLDLQVVPDQESYSSHQAHSPALRLELPDSVHIDCAGDCLESFSEAEPEKISNPQAIGIGSDPDGQCATTFSTLRALINVNEAVNEPNAEKLFEEIMSILGSNVENKRTILDRRRKMVADVRTLRELVDAKQKPSVCSEV